MVIRMFILGLTGPTGSGKSSAARILASEGFAVIDADAVSRRVVEAGRPCLAELAAAFGNEILNADGTLNRKKLAAIAFLNKKRVQKLNFITHPHIIKEMESKLSSLEKNGTEFVLLDAPALYESGADKICSRVLAVTARDEIRLTRIMLRDGITKAQAARRMAAQNGILYYTQNADYVVENNDDQESFRRSMISLAKQIKESPKQ